MQTGYCHLSRSWFSPFSHPSTWWENTNHKRRRDLIWNICKYSSCNTFFPWYFCCSILSALLLLFPASAGWSRDTWADFNDLRMPLKAAQCQQPGAPDWLPCFPKGKRPACYFQISVDNIKLEGHDLSLQGSQIGLCLVSLPQPCPLSVSHARTFFFCLFGDMHDSRAKNTFGRELQSYRGRQMHHSHWSSWELCLNSPCCLESFFVVVDLPIPLEYFDPNNMRDQRYQTDELLVLSSMLVWLRLWAALCSLAWSDFVLSSALPVLCLTWAALSACLLASFRSGGISSLRPVKLRCKNAMHGEIYRVRVSREWKSFLQVIPCPWDQGGISDLLMLWFLSPCNVPKWSWSLRWEGAWTDSCLPCRRLCSCLASSRGSVVVWCLFWL